jgi:hypothetical protein
MDKRERAEEKVKKAEEALNESRRKAAGRAAEDQGTEGGATEASEGHNPHTPERQEGEVPPSD